MTSLNNVLRADPGTSLTLEEMRRSLPSIFAEYPAHHTSDKYVYISTHDMLDRLIGSGFLPVEARMSRTSKEDRRPFTKHMLRFRSRSELHKPQGGSGLGVAFEVILRNAHDGSGAYQLLAGLIRFACTNGLIVSDGTVAEVKVFHRGNNRKEIIESVLQGAQTVLDQGPKVADKLRLWRSIKLDRNQAVEFARQAYKLRFADAKGQIKTAIQPEQLLIPRRPSDIGNSLWETFNVVQENAIRGGLEAMKQNEAGIRKRSVTRGINGIDGDVHINRKLWELADKTAELVA